MYRWVATNQFHDWVINSIPCTKQTRFLQFDLKMAAKNFWKQEFWITTRLLGIFTTHVRVTSVPVLPHSVACNVFRKGKHCRVSNLHSAYPIPARLPCSVPLSQYLWQQLYLRVQRALLNSSEPSPQWFTSSHIRSECMQNSRLHLKSSHASSVNANNGEVSHASGLRKLDWCAFTNKLEQNITVFWNAM